MAKSFFHPKFKVGQKVAYYSNEVVGFGEIVFVNDEKAELFYEYNVYPRQGKSYVASTVVEFVRRSSDGLYVSASSVSDRMPRQMLSHGGDMHAVNKWRYRPSLLERLIRKFSK